MRKLIEPEKEKIASTLKKIIDGREVSGICVYGSQVAGYARADSDYDVIVIVHPFRQKIKYYYLKGEADCSALVVDPKSFSKDCISSTYGEFVAGRLLNPFEAISGEDFFQQNEVAYKRRVILEGLIDAYAEQEDFASELDFSLSYFLFEKLKKRAAIYPPVVYSYSRTYGDDLIEGNLESSLIGFRKAAKALGEEDLISVLDEDKVRVKQQKFKGGISAKLLSAAAYTTKSLRQYAVHGYAGRVGPIVVGKEVVSKLSRSRTNSRIPDPIRYPKSYLSIQEGKLFADSDDWLADLLGFLKINPLTVRINQKPMGEIYTASTFYTIEEGANKFTIVVKRFNDIKGMKWGILNLWTLRNADFVVNPLARMFREYRAMREFRKFGLYTPEPLAVFLSQRIIVTKYIEGRDLSRLQTEYLNDEFKELFPFEKFGSSLAKLHSCGYCMGDTKPSNAILSDSNSEIYLADLEQSHMGGDKVWDLAEFIYYSVRLTMKEEIARKFVEAFLQGYSRTAEDKSVIAKTAALRYRAPFQAFIAPNVLSSTLNILKRG